MKDTMKKLAALATLTFVAAGAFAQSQEPAAKPGLIDWLYVKAVAVGCKQDIPGMERTMERTLQDDRRSKLQLLVDEAVQMLNLSPQDCIKATSWATRAVQAMDAGQTPPPLFN